MGLNCLLLDPGIELRQIPQKVRPPIRLQCLIDELSKIFAIGTAILQGAGDEKLASLRWIHDLAKLFELFEILLGDGAGQQFLKIFGDDFSEFPNNFVVTGLAFTGGVVIAPLCLRLVTRVRFECRDNGRDGTGGDSSRNGCCRQGNEPGPVPINSSDQ